MLWASAFLLPFSRNFLLSLVFFILRLHVPSFLFKLQSVRQDLLDLVLNEETISYLKNGRAAF